MTTSSPSKPTPAWQNPVRQLFGLSWPWRITLGYLTIMLLLPVAALALKASTESPAEFWRIATSPIALSTYEVTFVTALVAALINGVFGVLIAGFWFGMISRSSGLLMQQLIYHLLYPPRLLV
jgi:sulfate transport system permease protein